MRKIVFALISWYFCGFKILLYLNLAPVTLSANTWLLFGFRMAIFEQSFLKVLQIMLCIFVVSG